MSPSSSSKSTPPIRPAPAAGGAEASSRLDLPRELGRAGDPAAHPGPTLVVVAGMHGNEPAGVHAARRVLARLASHPIAMLGEMVVLTGNRQALAQGRRFVDDDLNRAWTSERVGAVRATPAGGSVAENGSAGGSGDPDRAADGVPAPSASAEDAELRELSAALDAAVAAAGGPVYVIDLHTTSSVSAPFALFADTLRNRAFALAFPLPLVLGLEEQVDGALLAYMSDLGCVCLGVEGGRHDAPASVDNLEAVIWLALANAGMIDAEASPDVAAARARLAHPTGNVPRLMEVRYRHPITPEDRFTMAPGYVNFQPIAAGEALAEDRHGAVRARERGRVLMPLYQGQGSDGFFMTRRVNPAWLGMSTVARRLGVCRVLPWLPGVELVPAPDETLAVNTRIARVLPLQVFHLLGYRKLRWDGDELVVSRGGGGRPRPARAEPPHRST